MLNAANKWENVFGFHVAGHGQFLKAQKQIL